MTVTELKNLLERAERMGYGTAAVTLVERTTGVYFINTYTTRSVTGAHLTHLGTNLLNEAADPTRDDYELRLDVDRESQETN